MELDYLQYLRFALLDPHPSDPDHGRWDNSQMKYLRSFIYKSVEDIFTQLKKEAQDPRDSLLMAHKIFEARAIEEMLHRNLPLEASFPIIPLRMIPTSKESVGYQMWMSSHPMWDLGSGRIFSLIRRFQDQSDASTFDKCEFVGTGPDDRRSLNLFLQARKVQTRVLNKYITPTVIRNWQQIVYSNSKGRENIKHVLSALDPVDLRAVRCLNDSQTVEYMTQTNLLSTTLPSLTGRNVFRVAIYEKNSGGENPLTREFFMKRQPYRGILGDKCSSLTLPRGSGEINICPPNCPPVNQWDDLLHVISSENIWPLKPLPMMPGGEQVMELYPKLELNALALAVICGEEQEVRRILRAQPAQASLRVKISDRPFMVFPSDTPLVYEFVEGFSVFHLAAWSQQSNALRELFMSNAVGVNLSWDDIIDLYAIAVMRRDKNLIEVLEQFNQSRFEIWVGKTNPDIRHFATVWSLAVEHSPHFILEVMLKGRWFESVEYESNLLPLILKREEYWNTEGIVSLEKQNLPGLAEKLLSTRYCFQILAVRYGREMDQNGRCEDEVFPVKEWVLDEGQERYIYHLNLAGI
ncbi:hypothetical protein AA313_de0209132 [Arthrobotrys entomopaga]|nr:hypothetical protein AA313_de0209132 [Arthrobotrys entomopaga]